MAAVRISFSHCSKIISGHVRTTSIVYRTCCARSLCQDLASNPLEPHGARFLCHFCTQVRSGALVSGSCRISGARSLCPSGLARALYQNPCKSQRFWEPTKIFEREMALCENYRAHRQGSHYHPCISLYLFTSTVPARSKPPSRTHM